jgi:thymidylate synthase
MYLNIPTQPSCGRAWVAAASAVIEAGDESYNVVIDVDDPTKFDERDNAVITLVDSFLRERDLNPIATVANTIFPESLYRKYGSPKFYTEYHTQVFDKLTTSKQWGRYFERITRRQDAEGGSFNPLQELIEKLKKQKNSDHRYKSVYELAIYDPLLDRKYLRGGQCLSFLSFKMHKERGLTLTAIYRNQTYITRCLGNLIGLGLLQEFVAKEAGLGVGPLTCISTHAEIDVGKGWGIADARELVNQAAVLLSA